MHYCPVRVQVSDLCTLNTLGLLRGHSAESSSSTEPLYTSSEDICVCGWYVCVCGVCVCATLSYDRQAD